MKKNFSFALIWGMLTCYGINVNAQFLNTKLGSNALSNLIGGDLNTAIGANSMYSTTNGSNNTAVGASSLYFNTEGIENTATGYKSLYNNTSSYNSAYGAYSLEKNTIGNSNTAVGYFSLNANEDGDYNTATGHLTLWKNVDGNANTANGYRSLNANISGSQNTAVGYQSLYSNTNGSYNTSGGYQSLHNSNANYNTAYGSFALYSNTTGEANIAIGDHALYSNKGGKRNTAIGSRYVLWKNVSGNYNTACGDNALYNNTGGDNTAIGAFALNDNTTGSANTAVGNAAMLSNITGSFNTAMGYYADVVKPGLTNATAIGYNAKVNASNKVRIGNNNVNSIGGQVGWTTFSDGRYKKDIKENIPGLSFINSLRPISYTVNVKGLNAYYDKDRKQVPDNKAADKEDMAAMQQSEDAAGKMVHNGFIAQEVEEAAKKLSYDFGGVDKPESKDDLYGLRYENFIVPLVKAVQELSQMNNELKKQNEDQQKQLNELNAIISGNTKTSTSFNDASLEQNAPNPFNKTTTIKYSLPKKFINAQIIITNKNGKALKQVNIAGSGKGTVNIDAATLAAGAYTYVLIVDGKVVSTKQMVLTK